MSLFGITCVRSPRDDFGPRRSWAIFLLLALGGVAVGAVAGEPPPPLPASQFVAEKEDAARAWQGVTRDRLVALMMGGMRPEPSPLRPLLLRTVENTNGGYRLEELTLQTLADRTVHAWVASPRNAAGKVGAVLALHGHGGTGEAIVRGEGLYWYGQMLAELGYLVIAPDIGQHTLQHTNWSLMGERVWDALRCVDYLQTRPEVDPARIAVAGLSLGGETAMYVAALVERIRMAVSSGWLSTVANLKDGHCPCWGFPGLEENFDFPDIFACIAPRSLVCELGEQERAPGGFPVAVGRVAFTRVQRAYHVFKADANAILTVHAGGHVFNGTEVWPLVRRELGAAAPWAAGPPLDRAELLRRGEIARLCFGRAMAVSEACWKTRDASTGLIPESPDQLTWTPARSGGDLLPALALTCFDLAPLRLESVAGLIPIERELTTRWRGLPDSIQLPSRAFRHADIDPQRLVQGVAEYCAWGLLPMTEMMGRGIWFDRMRQLIEAVCAEGTVRSDYGNLPAADAVTNGRLLPVLCRLYWLTGDQRYLDWAERIGDAYCLEVLPRNQFAAAPRWDFVAHRLVANEPEASAADQAMTAGLSELLLATRTVAPLKARSYEAGLKGIERREESRRADLVSGSENGLAAFGAKATDVQRCLELSAGLGGGAGRAAVQAALRQLDQPGYLDVAEPRVLAESLAQVLVWLNRFPEPVGYQWVERALPRFLSMSREDGTVKAPGGEGAYARAALRVGRYFTQGFRAEPWTPRLRFGAVQQAGVLALEIESEVAWSGRLIPDQPRSRNLMRLPTNYPRTGECPEWFTVVDDAVYAVSVDGQPPEQRTGARLRDGFFLELKPKAPTRLELKAVH